MFFICNTCEFLVESLNNEKKGMKMLLVYWEDDHEVSKYKDLGDFITSYGIERSYNNLHTATELSIVNGEITAVHYDVDNIREWIEEAEAEKTDVEEHGTYWGKL